MANKKYLSFKDTPVWSEAKNLTLKIYKITKFFPKAEQYGITSQLRRATSSICALIAEGFYRNSTKELINFLFMARGSCGECICFLILSEESRYITASQRHELEFSCDEIAKQLNGWIRSLKKLNH